MLTLPILPACDNLTLIAPLSATLMTEAGLLFFSIYTLLTAPRIVKAVFEVSRLLASGTPAPVNVVSMMRSFTLMLILLGTFQAMLLEDILPVPEQAEV